MSSFDINNAALTNSASFAKTIFNNYYPGGKSPVKNTSASLAPPVLGRTLSTRTISSMIDGDAFSRSPIYATKALKNSITSSLNTFVTGGASIASLTTGENNSSLITVENPESQGDKNDKITLGGAEAYNRIMANSIAGKNLGLPFVEQSINNMRQIEVERYTEKGTDSGSGITGDPSSEMQSAGRRDVAVVAELSEEEKTWFNERLTLLRSKYSSSIEDSSLFAGFSFDIPNQWADGQIKIYNGEDTYFPDARIANEQRELSDGTIRKAAVSAYIAPALIEFLLLMHEKNYQIMGALDAGRNPQRYYDRAVKEGRDATYLSDHTFGRAIDIKRIGRTNKELIDLSTVPPKETYDSAVRLLLEALADIPQYLLPDLIVLSGDLASDYGIVPGNEPITASIKLNKPYLQYINFSADGEHRNHIHLSFSGMRAGKYVGPGGQMVIDGTKTESLTAPITGGQGGFIEIPNFGVIQVPGASGNINKNYYGNWGATITKKELFDMLRTTGFSDEVSAIFVSILGRESGGAPTACNPNALTGDFMSLGIFQINMGVGGYRKNNEGQVFTKPTSGAAHGKKVYELTDANGKEQIQGWKIAIKNWKQVFPNDPEPTIDNYNRIITEKYESLRAQMSYNQVVEKMRELVDHRFWIPTNQAWALYTMRTGQIPQFGVPKIGATIEDGYQFGPYGDYEGRSEPGWLRGTRFSDAAEVYKTSGKTEENLKKWLKDVYKNDPDSYQKYALSRNYIDRWLNGEYFG